MRAEKMDFSDFQTERSASEELLVLVKVVQNKSSCTRKTKNKKTLTLLKKSTVGCQCETLRPSVSMRGSRVEVGSAQRSGSAPPVELQQGSGVHGRCNNSAH